MFQFWNYLYWNVRQWLTFVLFNINDAKINRAQFYFLLYNILPLNQNIFEYISKMKMCEYSKQILY